MTSIEWTEATWNPIAGCSVLSPGCTNCYAMRTAARLARIEATAPIYAGLTQPSKAGPVWTGRIALNEKALLEPLRRRKPTMYFVNSMSDLFHESVPDEVIDRIFAVMALCPQHTFQVLTKRSARMRAYLTGPHVFRWADEVQELSASGWPRARAVAATLSMQPLPNVWLGVSVEDQKRADERIPDLLATPAAVRFLSCEPLLGPVNIEPWLAPDKVCQGCDDGEGYGNRCARNDIPRDEQCPWKRAVQTTTEHGPFSADGEPRAVTCDVITLDWVIVGGESGPGARPMHPDWARSLRDQCATADVPFFLKQWGEWAPVCEMSDDLIDACYHPAPEQYPEASRRLRRKQCALHADGQRFDGEAMYRYPAFEQGSRAMTMMAISKKRAGRTLDGVTHDAMPEVHRNA